MSVIKTFCIASMVSMAAVGMGQVAAPAIAPAAAAASPAAKPLKERLDAIFNDAKWDSARWGVMVKDLETSQVLYEHDSHKSFMPASNMKLFTTGASFVTLGKDYRFETKIYATGTTDTEGVLHGNIVVVGSGDPSISGRYLDTPTSEIIAQWASAIKQLGIKKIDGDIIGDDDIFDDSSVAGSWSVDYMQEWYAAENSGLAINDNCWDTTVTLEKDSFVKAAQGTAAPLFPVAHNLLDTNYYKVDESGIRVIPDDDAPGSRKKDEGYFSIERNSDSNSIKLTGTMETDSAPSHEWGSIHNGTLFTVTLLAEELYRQNVTVSGKPVDIDDMNSQLVKDLKANRGTLVHTHVSPPISKIIALVNKPSQNFYADMLLKAVGAQAFELGSWNNGEKVVKDLLTTAGVEASSLNMSDGSGLSRRNMVAPRQVLALLSYLHAQPDFEVFKASLPIMGIDGTLKGRMAGTPAEGNVHAKTGTIGGVRALSGFMKANNDHELVFSMIANNYYTPTSDATEAQNQAVLELLNP